MLSRLTQGKLDDAVAAYREAIRLQHNEAWNHYNLGTALTGRGNYDDAVTAFHEAIRLKPDFAEARCNLGHAFRNQGKYAESLAMLRKGHELGSKLLDWSYPSASWVAEAERLEALAERLPALLKGTNRPVDNAERLTLAQMCSTTKRPAAAARFWTEALEADPKLGDDLTSGCRYNAACAAALAGTGQGKDDPPPDAATKARLRGQALGWMKADLTARAKDLETIPAPLKTEVAWALRIWQTDPDLAGVRDSEALARLPEAEREGWRALWAEVDALLKRAEGPKP